jgi:hypothetical protein
VRWGWVGFCLDRRSGSMVFVAKMWREGYDQQAFLI